MAHAYLFTGPRGTGKTTTARLLAMALNCPDREANHEPCGQCVSCSGVATSTSMDVIELDAASHNKVEDIREIKAGVSTVASAEGARRVFILDEAHMLTKSAANALLKTLEEPPDHVMFVLATTEPYRLVDTVRSRSQRFDFRLVPVDILVPHLRRICELEGLESADLALRTVARRAEGSVRDALSLLEQVAARDGTVSDEGVRKALGLAGPQSVVDLIDAVSSEDAGAVLELIGRLSADGVDLRRFTADILAFLRGMFLVTYGSDVSALLDEAPDVIDSWQRAADQMPPAALIRAIDLLGEALVRLREGRDERMMLELALIKLARPELDESTEALLRRVERLEKGRPVSVPAREPSAEEQPAARLSKPPASTDLAKIWPQLRNAVAERLGGRARACFLDASPIRLEGSVLTIALPGAFHHRMISADEATRKVISDTCQQILGYPVTVDFCLADKPEESQPVQPPESDDGSDPSSPAPAPPADLPVEPEPEVNRAAAMQQATFLIESELDAREIYHE